MVMKSIMKWCKLLAYSKLSKLSDANKDLVINLLQELETHGTQPVVAFWHGKGK